MSTLRGRNTGIWNRVTLERTGPLSIADPLVSCRLPLPDVSSADVTMQATVSNHGRRADELAHPLHLVGSQIVEDNKVTWLKLRHQHLLHERKKDISIGGRLNAHAGKHARGDQRRQDRQGAPMASKNRLAPPVLSPGPSRSGACSHLQR
jgi:hypothetical protein